MDELRDVSDKRSLGSRVCQTAKDEVNGKFSRAPNRLPEKSVPYFLVLNLNSAPISRFLYRRQISLIKCCVWAMVDKWPHEFFLA